jgi:putative nucleotidyltransferase with HDIG domain
VEELHTINRIMADFAAVDTSDDVLQHVIDLSLEITPASEARFFILASENMQPFEILSTATAAVDPALVPLVADAARDALPLLIAEKGGGKTLPPEIASFAAVPMKIRDKVFGVLATAVRSGDGRLDEGDLYYLSFMNQSAARAIESLALYENIYENLFSTLFAFVKAVEARDSYTQQHSDRVTELALKISRVMGCSSEERDILRFAGPLHDIGKIGIPDHILLKPGPLEQAEFERIKAHPVIGAGIIGQLGLWEREQQIVRWHHERYDGSGYPDGLAGEEIPLLARILAVADAFDAMSSNRVYRDAMDEARILDNLRKGAGSQFDPEVVEAFMIVHAQRQGAGHPQATGSAAR